MSLGDGGSVVSGSKADEKGRKYTQRFIGLSVPDVFRRAPGHESMV